MLNQHLNDGILLEDDSTLIPWNTPGPQLKRLGSPEVMEAKDVSTFHWHGRRILRGLRCTITTQLRNSAKPLTNEPDDEWIHATCLRYVQVARVTEAFTSAQAEFEDTSEHLRRVLGEPTFVSEAGDRQFLLKWASSELEVTYQIAERFTEYCVLQIRHN